MTAVASPGRRRDREQFDKLDCTLYPAKVAFPNARAVMYVEVPPTPAPLDGTLFRVKPAESGDTNTGYLDIGEFELSNAESLTGAATYGSKVTVTLDRHIEAEWWISDDALSGYYLGGLAYGLNDQTVTSTASTNVVVGRVWGTRTKNTVKQVLVQRLPGPTGTITIASGAPGTVLENGSAANQIVRMNAAGDDAEWGGERVMTSTALTVSWTSHDYAPTYTAVNAATGSVSRIIAPDASNCTITLPTTSVVAGTVLDFVKREATATYTVTIQEGSTALWTLTANKRGSARCVYDGTAWGVVGTSAP